MTIFLTTFGVALGCMVVWGLYNLYVGVHGNLNTAKVGEVYHFDYLQPLHGNPERFMVQIVNSSHLTERDIQRLNSNSRYRKNDPVFMRTNTLVTGRSADGKIRNFYADRVKNCKRSTMGKVAFNMGLAYLL